jgi:hypothetical protein
VVGEREGEGEGDGLIEMVGERFAVVGLGSIKGPTSMIFPAIGS